MLVALLLDGCAAETGIERDPERHHASGVSLELWKEPDGSDKPFAKYAADTGQALRRYRWKIAGESEEQRAQRIDLISPREWPPASDCKGRVPEGVLLVHGLTDTPYLMRDLGDVLHRMPGRCILVRSVLLPGHGSTPGDLVRATADHWKAATRYGVRSFAGSVGHLHIAGFSTGAALALHEALAGPVEPRIRSLILLSPAIRPHGFVGRLHVIPRIFAAVSSLSPALQWMDVHADRDYTKYESFPVNAAYQIFLLDEELNSGAGRVPVPVFMALAADDQTVSVEQAVKFFQTRTGASSRMILYVRPQAWVASREKYRRDPRIVLVDASDARRGVLELAHTATPMAPDNAHYGEHGDYTNCLHYLERGDRPTYCTCQPAAQRPADCPAGAAGGAQVRYGEKTKAHLTDKALILRRLTYNPKFSELLETIREFLDAVPSR